MTRRRGRRFCHSRQGEYPLTTKDGLLCRKTSLRTCHHQLQRKQSQPKLLSKPSRMMNIHMWVPCSSCVRKSNNKEKKLLNQSILKLSQLQRKRRRKSRQRLQNMLSQLRNQILPQKLIRKTSSKARRKRRIKRRRKNLRRLKKKKKTTWRS